MVRSFPRTRDLRLADGHGVFFRRQFFLDAPVEAFVLEENHRVVIADRRLDQPLGIVRRRRRHHFETGRAHEPHLRVLRVKRAAVNAAARRRAHHHGHRRVPAVAAFGGEIHNLVEAAGDEIGELHFRHRPQPHKRWRRWPHRRWRLRRSGVSTTRFSPKCSKNPSVTLNAPP